MIRMMIVFASLLWLVAICQGEERKATDGTPPQIGRAHLDIASFSVTQSVSAGDYVNFRLGVTNPGTVSDCVDATLIGVRDNIPVYKQTISVTAEPGGETKSYTFPAFKTASVGVVNWTVSINDSISNKATAITNVCKGYVPRDESER